MDIKEAKKSMNKKVAISLISSLLIGVLGTRLLVLLSQFRIFNDLRTGVFIIIAIFMLSCAFLIACSLEKKMLVKLFIMLSIFALSALVFIISFFFAWSDTMNF